VVLSFGGLLSAATSFYCAAGQRRLFHPMIDFGALFSQLISTYWWMLPLFVVAALFKSP
jgi:hypothetical protein